MNLPSELPCHKPPFHSCLAHSHALSDSGLACCKKNILQQDVQVPLTSLPFFLPFTFLLLLVKRHHNDFHLG